MTLTLPEILYEEATTEWRTVRVELRPEVTQTLSPSASHARVTEFIDGIIGKFWL